MDPLKLAQSANGSKITHHTKGSQCPETQSHMTSDGSANPAMTRPTKVRPAKPHGELKTDRRCGITPAAITRRKKHQQRIPHEAVDPDCRASPTPDWTSRAAATQSINSLHRRHNLWWSPMHPQGSLAHTQKEQMHSYTQMPVTSLRVRLPKIRHRIQMGISRIVCTSYGKILGFLVPIKDIPWDPDLTRQSIGLTDFRDNLTDSFNVLDATDILVLTFHSRSVIAVLSPRLATTLDLPLIGDPNLIIH